VQLIPKQLVVGALVPPQAPGGTSSTSEALNRIWTEVAGPHGFTQLQMSPDRQAANFIGGTPEDGMTIQPPLIQVRSTIATTAEQEAQDAQALIEVAARHLKLSPLFNLGVKHTYHVPAPGNDGRDFVLHRVLHADDADLAELGTPGDLIGGINVVIPQGDRRYTLRIEPLWEDQMKSLFVELDAQFEGQFEPDSITRRASEAQQFLSGPVDRYLDRLAEPR
jgi:hypothetical protein